MCSRDTGYRFNSPRSPRRAHVERLASSFICSCFVADRMIMRNRTFVNYPPCYSQGYRSRYEGKWWMTAYSSIPTLVSDVKPVRQCSFCLCNYCEIIKKKKKNLLLFTGEEIKPCTSDRDGKRHLVIRHTKRIIWLHVDNIIVSLFIWFSLRFIINLNRLRNTSTFRKFVEYIDQK